MFRLFAIALIASPLPASAQLPALGKSGGGLGGMLGGLGGIGTAGAGNAAGLLGYCVKNKLTGGAAAQGVLGKLTGQPAVTNAPGYAQGQLGQVLGGTAASGGAAPGFSLDMLKGSMKTKACDLVLKRAGSFL